MPKPGLPPDARDVLTLLDEYAGTAFPGARIDLSIFRASDGVIDGFALGVDGGLGLVYVDAPGSDASGLSAPTATPARSRPIRRSPACC
jgi:hypothetical protein